MSRGKVMQVARELGATVEIRGERIFTVAAEAPAGKVWSGCRVHELVEDAGFGDVPRKEVWAEMLSRMKHGVEDCEVENCEWCNDQ